METELSPTAPPPSPDQVDPAGLPLRFGRYTLTALLGEGGMGRVFQARLEGPEGFRKTLAIKVVRAKVAEQEGVREAIISEARVGGHLSHPHLVDIYDFGIEQGQPWIAMELVSGESLADRLARGPLPPEEALDLLIALTRGLLHLHTLRIDDQPAALVHRDLKPGNVLLGGDGRIKITDFGLARATQGRDAVTWSGNVKGTPAYMSPEQARGLELDGRSDLFALGAIGFEALTGERLLKGDTIFEIMSSILRIEDRLEDVRKLDHTLPGLGTLLSQCLRDERDQRFEDGARLLDGLITLRRAPRTRSVEGMPTVVSAPPLSAPSLPEEELDGVFVGRSGELDAARQHLDDGVRLISLVGAGGTGKTRLARRLARQESERFPGGVAFADLTQASSLDGICHAVAQAVDVGFGGDDPVEALGRSLHARGRLLLLADNFEHVAHLAGDTIRRWLSVAPQLVVLATSRSVLRVAGEKVLSVGPLPIAATAPRRADGSLDLDAAAAVPAVELFVARAQEANPAFTLSEDNVEDVVQLVEALEGIPLAIELAAARSRLLSPGRILQRLPRRFDLLTTGRADVTARQATLKATVDWSWDLLAPWERAALAWLSVFRGGFSLDAAEAVLDLDGWPEAPWAMDVVQSLVDKSLLRAFEPPGLSGETRFAPYETIREYAAEKLVRPGAVKGPDGASITGPDAKEAAEQAHGHYFANLPGPPRAVTAWNRWRRSRALELENLVAAADRAAERGDEEVLAASAERALDLALSSGAYRSAALWATRWLEATEDPARRRRLECERLSFLLRTGSTDAMRADLDRLIAEARETGDAATLGDALVRRSLYPPPDGSLEDCTADADEAFEVAKAQGDSRRQGLALLARGTLASMRSLPSLARADHEQSLQLLRRAGDHLGELRTMVNLSVAYRQLGANMLLEGTLQETLRRARDIGYKPAVISCLVNLGVRWQETGRLIEALGAYEEAAAVARRSGDFHALLMALGNCADCRRELGELERSLEQSAEALEMCQGKVGARVLSAMKSIHADGLAAVGRLDEAAALLLEAEEHARTAGSARFVVDVLRRRGGLLRREGDLEGAEALLAEARESSKDGSEANHEARVLGESAEVARLRGDLVRAEVWLDEADELARGSDDRIYQGVLACLRAKLERDVGAEAAALESLAVAETVAQELELPPGSELGLAIQEARG